MRKTAHALHLILFLTLLLLLVSCGGGDTGVVPEPNTVMPLYSINGANWNDYVTDDGSDIFSASDTSCNPVTDTSCLHGGQIMTMEVPDQTSCVDLSVDDSLSVFEWVCDDSVSPVRFISTGFKPEKGLSDLIDFDSVLFRENYLTVQEAGNLIFRSAPETWWKNSIVVNNDGSDGSDMNTGEIHIVTQSANATYTIGVDRVALLVKPGIILSGSAAINEKVVQANSDNFVWIEGTIDASGDVSALSLNTVRFSVLHNLNTLNSNIVGVDLLTSSNNSLSNITAYSNANYSVRLNSSASNSLSNITTSGNNYGLWLNYSSYNNLSNITVNGNNHGLWLSNSSNNSLNKIISNGNADYGVWLSSSTSNTLNNITSIQNTNHGVFIYSSSNNNSLSNVTVNGNTECGVRSYLSTGNSLSNITASGNAFGVYLYSSTNNSLGNITASENINFGVYLYYSSNNKFTSLLQVGSNADCYVNGGTDPGLNNGTCANQGSSDATLTAGVSVANSFVNPTLDDYSLLATDTMIRDVLNLPSGTDTYTHTWSDSSTTTMLRNAVEIVDDGIGNDDMICESFETCIYTPNIAAYQGHGDLALAGTFSDGTISGVTLMQYETNGY